MRGFMKWIARTVGTAISLVLVIVLMPYASKLAEQLLPAIDGAAINTSVTLRREMENSARLETVCITEEGVLNSSTSAMLLGEVQSVTVKYTYTASIGIDLTRVGLSVDGNTLTFTIPQPEVLADSLHPDQIVRDDFWYPLTDSRRQELLDEEQAKCREYYLQSFLNSDDMWQRTVQALESTIGVWLGQGTNGLTFKFVPEQAESAAVPLG